MEGVTVSIIRAGKYKALANQNEPLSKEGRAQIQADLPTPLTRSSLNT